MEAKASRERFLQIVESRDELRGAESPESSFLPFIRRTGVGVTPLQVETEASVRTRIRHAQWRFGKSFEY